jgi:hypothetical protein
MLVKNLQGAIQLIWKTHCAVDVYVDLTSDTLILNKIYIEKITDS